MEENTNAKYDVNKFEENTIICVSVQPCVTAKIACQKGKTKEKYFPVVMSCIGRKPRERPPQDLRSFLFAKAKNR